VLFGFKLGLTNWGLHLAPTVNFHLLVQSCSVRTVEPLCRCLQWISTHTCAVLTSIQLFFVILFAFFILRERPTIWALLCAAGATAGAILVSLEFEHVSAAAVECR
jgi:drug/metabolite transporter (DMT)-like permease